MRLSPTRAVALLLILAAVVFLLYSVAPQRSLFDDEPELVVAVLSSPDGIKRRNAIRETWMTNVPREVVVKFIVGIKDLAEDKRDQLSAEAEAHGDIALLGSIVETYKGLANKTLAMFRWADATYPSHRFLMKVDDDTFVRLGIVLASLTSVPDSPPLYLGYFDGRAPVRRQGKWAEPKWVLSDRYLPYALGGGYVVGREAVQYIARNAHLFELYNSEDVSVGVWLAPLKLNRKHDLRFDTEWKTRGCQNKFIVMHKQEPHMMKDKHAQLVKTDGLECCAQERILRKEYTYNWNTFASKCCPGRGVN